MGERVVTINDVRDGHTVLDISWLDRLYLSAFVQKLQTPGGVVFFLHEHRGMPIASPAVFDQIGSRFRDGMRRFAAETNHIPVVRFRRDDRKVEVMRPYLDRAATTGRSQVAAIGVAQEFAPVWTARKRDTDPAKAPQFSFNQAAAAGHGLLRGRVGRRLRPRVHQALRLLPLPDQGLGQWP